PVVIIEGAPDNVFAVDGDWIVDPQRFGLPADVVDVLFKSEFRGMDADDDQPLVLVLVRPGAKVGLRAQPVDAGVCPEMDEDDLSAQGRRGEWRRVEPCVSAFKGSEPGLVGNGTAARPMKECGEFARGCCG